MSEKPMADHPFDSCVGCGFQCHKCLGARPESEHPAAHGPLEAGEAMTETVEHEFTDACQADGTSCRGMMNGRCHVLINGVWCNRPRSEHRSAPAVGEGKDVEGDIRRDVYRRAFQAGAEEMRTAIVKRLTHEEMHTSALIAGSLPLPEPSR